MITLYTFCAVAGGSVLVLQFILSMIGLWDDSDMAEHTGGDTDFDGHGDAGFDGHGDAGIDHGEAGYTDHEHLDAHDSSFFFRIFSLRAVIAAIAFFGIGGGLSDSMGVHPILCFLVAVSAAACAMVTVAWIFSLFYSLREDGTAHIQHALGLTASVYLTIPENNQGSGKVTVLVRNRTNEYLAVTEGEKLPTGTPVVITDIISDTTVKVKRDTHD